MSKRVNLSIKPADLERDDFVALIVTHKQLMLKHSPPESSHALTVDDLRADNMTVWAMHVDEQLVGCGALKALEPSHGEIKSMHTIEAYRRQGLGRAMLFHIIAEARARSCEHISLETGAMDGFRETRSFYEHYGFIYCKPIKGYVEDINSVFMTYEPSLAFPNRPKTV